MSQNSTPLKFLSTLTCTYQRAKVEVNCRFEPLVDQRGRENQRIRHHQDDKENEDVLPAKRLVDKRRKLIVVEKHSAY